VRPRFFSFPGENPVGNLVAAAFLDATHGANPRRAWTIFAKRFAGIWPTSRTGG
jgi:hypothetical protein